MDIDSYFDQMDSYLVAKDWDGLEAKFEEIATRLAGSYQSSRIASIDFSQYQKSLCKSFTTAIERANAFPAKAVYFEYDLDNDWQSSFFICQHYNPGAAGDDDWASDWVDQVNGPDFPELSEIYSEHHFDKTDTAKGSTLFLVARTVATFGRCIKMYEGNKLALCIAFHDQDPIMRIREVV